MRYLIESPTTQFHEEISIEELAERVRTGRLPMGARVARVSSRSTPEWVEPLQDKALVQLIQTRDNDGPQSQSTTGVETLSLGKSLEPGSLTEDKKEVHSDQKPKEQAKITPIPKRFLSRRTVLLGAILPASLIAILGSYGLYVWLKLGYARGQVLEYIPKDCTQLFYVDINGVEDPLINSKLRTTRDQSLVDWVEELDDDEGFRKLADDEGKGRTPSLIALKKRGIKPFGDVREFAICERNDGAEVERLMAIGGSFRGQEVLSALRDALSRRLRSSREDKFELVDFDGKPALKMRDGRHIVQVSSRVLLVGKPRMLRNHLQPTPTARTYGIREKEVIVLRTEGRGRDRIGAREERYEWVGDTLKASVWWVSSNVEAADATAKKFYDVLTSASHAVRKFDGLDVLANGYTSATYKQTQEEVRFSLEWSKADLRTAFKGIVETDRREARKMMLVLRGAPVSYFLRSMVTPGFNDDLLQYTSW